jgi:hypothetical protein
MNIYVHQPLKTLAPWAIIKTRQGGNMKTERKTVLIPAAVHEALRVMSKNDGRTLSGLMLKLIEIGMKAMKGKVK